MNTYVLLLMYDIPTKTAADTQSYRKLFAHLHRVGFYPLQDSIYIKPLNEKHKATAHIEAIKALAHPQGHIRALVITQQQFTNMYTIVGKDRWGEALIKKQKSVLRI